jgi:PAS domain S-box-containing protein
MKTLLIAFTVIRLLILPLLLILAFKGYSQTFIVFFIATVILGLTDEIIARKYDLFTTKRSRVCSWSDSIALIVIIIGSWVLWPEYLYKEVLFLAVVLICFFTPIIIGYVKYSRLTSYHTWMSRISLLLITCGVVALFMGRPNWFLHFSITLYICAEMEEIAITAILPDWEFNVPSIWHAINIERQRAEEARIRSEEKLRTLLTNIDDGYFELDLKGNLIFFNPVLCKRMGYTEHELLGMNNREFMTEEMAKKVYQIFNNVYKTGKSFFGPDWTIITKSGKTIYFEAAVSLLRNSKGDPVGFRCIGRDITERKNAEEAALRHQEQLYQASKMAALGTLVSGVAHEINNPNNFIMLNAPLLREVWEGIQPILSEYYKENGDFTLAGMDYTVMREKIPLLLSGIEAGSSNILKIVQDLKEYVKEDSTGFDNDVDLNKIVESALSLISNMIQKSTKHFFVNYDKNLPCIKGNFHRLEQVVINLLQNACQALKDKENAIRLTTVFERRSGYVTLIIDDEGVGIPEKNLGSIMEPFFTTKQDKDSLGLGLSITKRIIEGHGGKIAFESEEGKGTKITVSLPVSKINNRLPGVDK